MSESAGAQAPQRPQNKKQQRKRVLLLLTAIFIMIGVAYLIYWFLVLRHHQETDNAYISGNQVQIMSQVPGSVVSVHFENTDFVKSGDVLVTLDPTDAEQAFEQAKTALANSVRQTHQLIINSKQYQANIALKKTELSQAQNDLKRRVVLGLPQSSAVKNCNTHVMLLRRHKRRWIWQCSNITPIRRWSSIRHWRNNRRLSRRPLKCVMPGSPCSAPK